MKEWRSGSSTLRLLQGDITTIPTDAIVNAANEGLRGGGGVDGAIHRTGGPTIMEECRRVGGCPTGQARMTGAGNLPAQRVLHAVGPVWQGGDRAEADLLASAYRSSLELAAEHGMRRITFPSLSTGAYGYPVERAAPVALHTMMDFIERHPGQIDEVLVILLNSTDLEVYQAALAQAAAKRQRRA